MENHPIPQDVTGFKFKLIGSMTVKQFLYLLGAGILCALFFIMPIPFILKWPIIFAIGGAGAALAFLPIEGRPLDVMIVNFAKAIPAENRFIFHKRGANALLHTYFEPAQEKKVVQKVETTYDTNKARRELLVSQLVRKNAPYRLDDTEREELGNIQNMFNDAATPVTGPPALEQPIPATHIVRPNMIVRPPVDLPEPEAPQQVAAPEPEPTPTLEVAAAPPNPVPENEPAPNQGQSLATPESQVASGFPMIPDTPNVVLGIVKDARGRILPNMIIEVVDENKTPVRAFKTNALGQFAAATPLTNGSYQILIEDPRHIHEFSPIAVELTGDIFQPLEIISVDQREKLRQELFGAQQQTAQQ